jgi:hypothetical protein
MHSSDQFSQQDDYHSKLVDKFFKINNYRPNQNPYVSNISAYFSTRRLSDAYNKENKSFKYPENVLKSEKKEKNVSAKLKKSALRSISFNLSNCSELILIHNQRANKAHN